MNTFTDDWGWVPGIDVRLDMGGFYLRDQDADVVVPSLGGADYDWRVVWPDGSPATDFYGGGWGTGNPIDGLFGIDESSVSFGTQIEIANVANDNSWATIHIWNSRTTPRNR